MVREGGEREREGGRGREGENERERAREGERERKPEKERNKEREREKDNYGFVQICILCRFKFPPCLATIPVVVAMGFRYICCCLCHPTSHRLIHG